MMQDSGRRDEEVDLLSISRGSRHPPAARGELSTHDFGAKPDTPKKTELLSNCIEVVADLRAGRKQVAPVRLLSETELVEPRGHVTCQAGVRIVPPRATNTLCLLVDPEIGDPGST